VALRFIDSFDHYVNTDILLKWTSINNTASLHAGRTGPQSFHTGRNLSKTIDAQTEWILGFAVKPLTGSNSGSLVQLKNGASTIQDDIYWDNGTQCLSVRRAGTTTLGTGSRLLAPETWHYVELRIVVSNTVGVVQLHVDGANDINLSSQDTLNSGTTIDRFTFGDAGASNISCDIDDVYICDASGSAPSNTFLGDVRIECTHPNGNGNSSQLVGSDGNSTDNYLLVDETTSDGDTTYVQSSVVNDKDTYAYGNLSSVSGSVYGVQPIAHARKTDASSRSMKTIARLSGTEVDGPDQTLATSYAMYYDIRETKPGGGAWTISDVNSAEFGVKVAS
jgi:hypothetical protein